MTDLHKLDITRPRLTKRRHPAISAKSRRGIEPMSEEPEEIAATLRPTEPQRRYLERGLAEPGGKLPLFDRDGREVVSRTTQACIPWLGGALDPQSDQARLAGLPADRKGICGART